MTSSVFFKFKSQKEPSRVEFDGTGISVFELKRDIIIKSGLGDGHDFDLAIYVEDGMEEYDDDTTVIPRSTTVIARRLPPLKPGAGRAARYVTGKMPGSAKNRSRREDTVKKTQPSTAGLAQMSTALTEEEKLAAMFQVQSDQWNAQQEEMANQAPVYKPGSKKPVNVPDHEPPTGYICYRCGQKGHWIQACPTNDNPEFDNRPRVKRTTGIPRSFLKTVDKSAFQQGEGEGEDGPKPPAGVMVNADGDYVIAKPDTASWEKFQAKTKTSAAAQKAASDEDKDLEEKGLLCAIDKRLFIDPMKTPCCEKTYCNDCITNSLIENDLVCPGCDSEGVPIDDLRPDTETSRQIQDYLKEKDMAKTKERSKSPTIAKSPLSQSDNKVEKDEAQTDAPKTATTSAPEKTQSPSPSSAAAAAVKSASAEALQKSATPNPVTNGGGMNKPDDSSTKKRPADELLENPKIPKAPKAMQKAQEAKEMHNMMANGMPMMPGLSNMPNMSMMNPMMGMNGFNGFPNMAMGMGMGMPMMPNMMNPMMGMNGFNGGGFPNMNGFGGNFGPGGNMNGGGMGVGMGPGGLANMNNGFQHPNRTNFTQPNNDEDAYFRKPVNPGRHQNRQRRNRPSDYREL
ncbi:DWNN domain-containing protein [Pseudomassariella vexata]|uniref:DWNN domain-domain-containing protein n=1 Tax=Pseudomassariella vexata TaxID=1141098 RepID=A0A1Y2DV89_9PEZI|nr:DWNN domain-containing protein [Pseudomassariella vexata]ORY63046.1 DWNN domain-domain-containing protein [Pseudomassariella vexata]